jgi:hypothetical protein
VERVESLIGFVVGGTGRETRQGHVADTRENSRQMIKATH